MQPADVGDTGRGTPGRRTGWLKSALGVVLLAAVAVYVVRNAEALRDLPSLPPAAWLAVVALTAAIGVTSVLAVQGMLAAVGAATRFGEMFVLHNAAYLLNLLPAKPGTLLRATYLRRHHDFSFPRFGVFAIGLTLLTILVSAVVGLVSLLLVYGLDRVADRIFAALLAACAAGSAVFLVVPVPAPAWPGRVGEALREVVAARTEVRRRPRGLLVPGAWLLAGYLLTAVRFGVIYTGLGFDVHPGGLLLLGALGQVSALVSLTPGALGVRELLVGGGATVLGISVEAGLLVALIERAVSLAWAAVVGVPSAVWVWRRRSR